MMKKYFRIFAVLAAISSLTSCLKEDGVFKEGGNTGILELVGLPIRTATTTHIVSDRAYENAAVGEVVYKVNYVGEKGPSKDLQVVWDYDNAAVLAASPTYNVLPASLIVEEPSKTVVIKAGQKTADIVFKVKIAELSYTNPFAIGIKLVSGSQNNIISGNYGAAVFLVKPKNTFDGIYSVNEGYIQRYAATGLPTTGDALNGDIPRGSSITLATITETTARLSGLSWNGGGAVGGIDNVTLTLNPATNKVTVSSSAATDMAVIPGLENSYNPTTKEFILNFDWNRASGLTKREVKNLKIKYSKSR